MATGFDKFLSKPLPTTVKPTEHGLRTIIRRWEISAEALRAANVDTNAFPAYETPDEEYTSALLVEQSTGDGTAFGVKLMYWRVYQELPANTTDLVQLGNTVFSTTENGLQTAEQRSVARAGHVLTGDIGVTVGGAGTDVEGLYLAGHGFAERGRVSAVVVKRWAEAGLLNKSAQPGPSSIPGTKTVTYVSQGVPFYPSATLTPISTGTAATGDKAKLIGESDGSVEGFTQYTRTYLVVTDIANNITGLKYTITGGQTRVQVPGVINCVSTAVSLGGVSGTIADVEPTPKTTKEINVTQTIEITTSPPAAVVRAFNIDAISCAVLRKQMSLSKGPGNTVTFGSDTNRMSVTGENQRFSASANLQVYPGYYLGVTPSSGAINYVSSSYPVVTDNVSVMEEITSNQATSCAGTGSTTADGYSETGIVDQKGRPVYNTLDGTVYWEVTKWTVAA